MSSSSWQFIAETSSNLCTSERLSISLFSRRSNCTSCLCLSNGRMTALSLWTNCLLHSISVLSVSCSHCCFKDLADSSMRYTGNEFYPTLLKDSKVSPLFTVVASLLLSCLFDAKSLGNSTRSYFLRKGWKTTMACQILS